MGVAVNSVSGFTMVFQKAVVVDCKDHLLGRLASTIAKELLMGQKVVAVRCEDINISGSFIRNKLKYGLYLRKRCNVRPTHGPFHYRRPGMMLHRVIRGMLPHKLAKGKAALGRLKVFEGVPPPYDRVKRVVIPDALRVIKLAPCRRYCTLGRIAHEMGWKYQDVVKTLEEKRKVKGKAYFERALKAKKLKAEATKAADLKTVNETLSGFGF